MYLFYLDTYTTILLKKHCKIHIFICIFIVFSLSLSIVLYLLESAMLRFAIVTKNKIKDKQKKKCLL